MPRPIPTPVAALVGLVPTVADQIRQLPLKTLRLPIVVLSGALNKVDRTRSEYAALADRGTAFVGRLRGTAGELATDVSDRADGIEERLEDLVTDLTYRADGVAGNLEDSVVELAQDTPLPEAAPAVEVPEQVQAKPVTLKAVPRQAEPRAEPEQRVPAAEQPKGEPTPRAPKAAATRKPDTAASPAAALAAELVAEASQVAEVDHSALPLEDYDHMTLGSLRGRLRSLSSDELVQIRTYERAHADRLPVVTMLDNRIAKLAADASSPAAYQAAVLSGADTATGPAAASPADKAAADVKADADKADDDKADDAPAAGGR